VWVVEVEAAPRQVPREMTHAVQVALAQCPRGVVLALPAWTGAGEEVVAAVAGCLREATAWREVVMVVACHDEPLRHRLQEYLGDLGVATSSSMLNGWAAALAHPRPRRAERTWTSRPASVPLARRFVRATCEKWGMPDRGPNAELVVSELAGNTARHALGRLTVVLSSDRSILRVAVRDQSHRPPVDLDAGVTAETGRGLSIVQAVAETWGVLPSGDGGKLVWATIGPQPQ
jgi:hypothetical protein